RSSRESCRLSGSWASTQRPGVHGRLPLWSDCVNLAGSTVARSRSSIAGRRDAPSAPPRSRPSSSVLRSMSLSREATTVIPVVFAIAQDPVGGGLVARLGKPGGNVTGLSRQASDVAGKRVELLREVVLQLRRLAILVDFGNPQSVLEMGEVQAAARMLGIEVAPLAIRRAEDIAPAF